MLFDLPASRIKHPAKYSDALLGTFVRMLRNRKRILDPFSGTGKIFLLQNWLKDVEIFGVEIEHEWACIGGSMVGNALCLPLADNSFDAICTSPTYGNHMADQSRGEIGNRIHKAKTNKYFAHLGRKMHSDNSGKLHWNKGYQEFHIRAWCEVARVLSNGGVFVLNIKNHIRNGQEQFVTEWHVETLLSLGFVLVEHVTVNVPSTRFGRNSEKRMAFESIILFRYCL